MWEQYLAEVPGASGTFTPCVFGDNPEDADALAQLVLAGEKRATAPSLWELEAQQVKLPRAGDLQVVLNGNQNAQCIIATTAVAIVPFEKVSVDFVRREGEGDKSLRYWRQVHWAYYTRILAPFGLSPSLRMPVVCEDFEVVFRP